MGLDLFFKTVVGSDISDVVSGIYVPRIRVNFYFYTEKSQMVGNFKRLLQYFHRPTLRSSFQIDQIDELLPVSPKTR